MKGSGEIINKIIIALFILGLLSIFIFTLFGSALKEQRIIFEEMQLLAVKNTFYLTEKSLGVTWLVSTAQTIFKAQDGVGEEYWYRTDPAQQKLLDLPSGKCNNGNPRICLPQVLHASEFFKEAMKEYTNIPGSDKNPVNEVKVGTVAVNIKDIDIGRLWPGYDGVKYQVKQNIIASQGDTTTDRVTTSKDKIKTMFRKMLFGGWLLVDFSIKQQGNDYSDQNYLENKKKEIDSQLSEIASWLKPLESDFSTDAELVASEGGMMPPQGGLLLHYKVDASFIENVAGIASSQCKFSDVYDKEIGDAVSSSDWKKISREKIASLVRAMIQQESSWNAEAVSCAGAAGLMQLMPDTARGLGLSVPQYESVSVECGGMISAAACNSYTPEKCDKSSDERFEPGKNIAAGVKYLNEQLHSFDKGDEINKIKLALAAYNGGPGRLKEAMKKAKSDTWEQVAPHMPEETGNYVSAIMSCYVFYGGVRESYNVYALTWPTNGKSISGFCFAEPTSHSRTGFHMGIDVTGARGDDMFAVSSGKIVDTEDSCVEGNTACGGRYGNFVMIKHDDDLYSFYSHLSKVTKKSGDVDIGEKIGEVGNTGYSLGAHLHLEIRKTRNGGIGNVVNPCDYLDCSRTKCSGSGQPLPIDYNIFQTKSVYYYHDEASNRFVKRPFSLKVKIEDYLPVLDCSQNNEKTFTLKTEGDMLCMDNSVWTCARDIEGLGLGRKQDRESVGSYKCLSATERFCKQGDDTRTIDGCCINWPDTGAGTFCNNFCAGDGVLDSGEGCMSSDAQPCSGSCSQGKTMTCTGTVCSSKCECV